MTFTEFKTAIDSAVVGCDETHEGKFRALMNGPDVSPKEFSTTYNRLISL